MAKKTQKRNTKRPNARAGTSKKDGGHGGFYLIIGILVGVIGVGAFLFKSPLPPQQTLAQWRAKLHHKAELKTAYTKTTKKTTTSTTNVNNTANNQPKFDFYTMLPQMQVNVPGETNNPNATIPTPNMTVAKTTAPTNIAKVGAITPTPTAITSSTSKTNGNYVLQVASFRDYQDADRVKAHLTLLGFNVTVQPITVNGQTWNRVYIGPFNSLALAKSNQQQLAAQHVNSIIIVNGQG